MVSGGMPGAIRPRGGHRSEISEQKRLGHIDEPLDPTRSIGMADDHVAWLLQVSEWRGYEARLSTRAPGNAYDIHLPRGARDCRL